LTGELGGSLRFGADVVEMGRDFVRLASGETYRSPRVVDARGFLEWDNIQVGYQKFIGWEVALAAPRALIGADGYVSGPMRRGRPRLRGSLALAAQALAAQAARLMP
jgi:hypothetical protein